MIVTGYIDDFNKVVTVQKYIIAKGCLHKAPAKPWGPVSTNVGMDLMTCSRTFPLLDQRGSEISQQ